MRSIYTTSVVFVLLFAVILAGCKKDSSTPSTPGGSTVPATLVGTWTPQSATLNGQPASLAQVLLWEANTVQARLTINANGTFTSVELDANGATTYTSSGTFAVSGQTATVTTTSANGQPVNPPETQIFAYAVAGNQLTLTATIPQVGTLVVVLTK